MLPFADTPALPLDEAGKYVAGAYIVFVLLILVYVAIMAAKLQRIERELHELAGFAEARTARDRGAREGRPDGDRATAEEEAAPGRESEPGARGSEEAARI
jgi:hypothetical protein